MSTHTKSLRMAVLAFLASRKNGGVTLDDIVAHLTKAGWHVIDSEMFAEWLKTEGITCARF